MQVIEAEPPMIEEIDRVFHTRGKPVLYAWGDRVYIPMPLKFTPALQAHERVHGLRQRPGSLAVVDSIEHWWARYLADPAFRLAEEIPAHRAEYQWWASQPNADDQMVGWRSRKQYHLHFIATRLASKLYGNLITLGEAKRLIAA